MKLFQYIDSTNLMCTLYYNLHYISIKISSIYLLCYPIHYEKCGMRLLWKTRFILSHFCFNENVLLLTEFLGFNIFSTLLKWCPFFTNIYHSVSMVWYFAFKVNLRINFEGSAYFIYIWQKGARIGIIHLMETCESMEKVCSMQRSNVSMKT